jgi:chaperonin GroES
VLTILGEIQMNDFKIKPLEDRVIIKAGPAEEKSKGGIILPDTVKEKPIEGTIIAAGPGRIKDDGNTISLNVKVGDKVLYGKYSGTEITVEDEEYLIMRESDIFGILS